MYPGNQYATSLPDLAEFPLPIGNRNHHAASGLFVNIFGGAGSREAIRAALPIRWRNG